MFVTGLIRVSARLTAAIAVACLIGIRPGIAAADLESEIQFNIPPQQLPEALLKYAQQSRVQVTSAAKVVEGKTTAGVVGTFPARLGLERLLAGTALSYDVIDPNTVVIRTQSRNGSSPATATGQSSVPARQGSKEVSGRSFWERFRLTQVAAEESPVEVSKPGSPDHEEVVVTGTHIEGSAPVGSNVISIDRDEIFRSGLTTVAQVVQALPQSFGGGPQDATLGFPSNTNSSMGSSLNLRGLGEGATLVLLNGRRLAPAGGDASFVDVGSIPTVAIERIEILSDGASAVYGSDAVSGVVNIVLRQDYDGAESRAQFVVPTQGSGRGAQFAQTVGTRWGAGNGFVTYEYYERDALPARERTLTQNADLRHLGGSDFRGAWNNPGTIVSGTRTWAIPAGQDGRSLTATDFTEGTTNPHNPNDLSDITPSQQRHSAVGVVNHSFGDKTTVSADLLFSRRDAERIGSGFATNITVPNTNPFYVNPTGATTPVSIRYNFGDDLGPQVTNVEVSTFSGSTGIEHELGRDWKLSLRGSYGREEVDQKTFNYVNSTALSAALARTDPATAFNPFGDGSYTSAATLAEIRARALFASTSAVTAGTAAATGRVLAVPAGEVKLALGAEFQRQEFATDTAIPGVSIGASYDRDIRSGYGELLIPIFGQANERPLLHRVDVSLAARHERYSDFGSATTPKLGLTWALNPAVALRATWGKSFKAPNLPTLDESNNFLFLSATPNQDGSLATILTWNGQNADLTQERSTAWSAGIDLTPPAFGVFRMALTYFDIDYTDRITALPGAGQYLVDPVWADSVTRAPTVEQRARACMRGRFIGASPDDCLNAPVVALVDLRAHNTAVTHQTGVDLLSTYSFTAGVDRFDVSVNAAYLIKLEQAQLAPSAPLSILDTPFNPTDLKFRAAFGWTRGGLGASVAAKYVDSYRDDIGLVSRTIGSWTTVDVHLLYAFADHARGWANGLTLAGSVLNAFDENPPFFNNSSGVGYDPTNADILGRTVSVQLRKSW